MQLDFWGFLLACFLTSFISRTEAEKKILITGGAGFIGLHTGLKLAEDKHNIIVVLDIFDDSYDIHLKEARASILKTKGVTVHSGDVCSQQMLEHLFETHNFSHVVHLAAKEGTQASMEDPSDFIQANTECLLMLLKVLVGHKGTRLVYTSSYNVLDIDGDGLTPAISLYTALKTGGERLVTAYCHDYGISAIGIRPFNVYGPWGRPDGDIYRMAQDINDRKTVKIYTNKDSAVASRDYTFVSDVVNGVILAMNRWPEKCGEIYNIGSGAEPVSMETVFSLLKEEMGKDANKKFTFLPKFEPLVIKADITDASRVLGYKPAVNIKQGIRDFVQWFKEYHIHKKWSSPPGPDDSLIKKLEADRVMYLNKNYKKRLVAARREYEKKAPAYNLPVTKYYHKDFVQFKNTELKSSKQGYIKSTSISILTDWCQLIDECVAFDSRGVLYSHIPEQKEWVSSSIDLYVADIDICKAGMTSCYGNCTCSSVGHSQAKYDCKKGFGMLRKKYQQDYCLELYVPGRETEKEKEFKILDKMEDRDWDSFISGKEYVHFPNTNMDYGVVAYYPDAAGDVEKLKAACNETYHCMGFTTNGELKGIINHVHRWKKSDQVDLYLRDVDYCSMHEEKCKCQRVSPAKYGCSGRKP